MAQKIIQANIAFSRTQVQKLNILGVDVGGGVVGIISYLGTDVDFGKDATVMIQFMQGQYKVPLIPVILTRIFKVENFILMQTSPSVIPEIRVIVTTSLSQPLNDPYKFLCMRARLFISALERYYVLNYRTLAAGSAPVD